MSTTLRTAIAAQVPSAPKNVFRVGAMLGEGFCRIMELVAAIIWKIRPFLSDRSALRGIASACGGRSMKRKAKNGFDD